MLKTENHISSIWKLLKTGLLSQETFRNQREQIIFFMMSPQRKGLGHAWSWSTLFDLACLYENLQ